MVFLPAVCLLHLTLVAVELRVGAADHLALAVLGTLEALGAVLGRRAMVEGRDNDTLAAGLPFHLAFGPGKTRIKNQTGFRKCDVA